MRCLKNWINLKLWNWTATKMSVNNRLILGDNLQVLGHMLEDTRGSFDLVYIDPPFATNNVFRSNATRAATISSASDGNLAYSDVFDLETYIGFLEARVVVARDLLSAEGSFYIHTDTKVGHYVKVMMDRVFGRSNFRNEITRIKSNPKNFDRRAYGNIKDTVLFYTKGDSYIWNEPRVLQSAEVINQRYNKVDESGRRYTTTPLHAPGETKDGATGCRWREMMPPAGRHWRYAPAELDALDAAGLIEWSSTGNPRKIIYADEVSANGVKMQDVWEYKDPQVPTYPTEKNLAMLEKIVATSSDEGSWVLDFFCGSGTTLRAASNLGRCWVGVDQSPVAIDAARARLGDVGYEFEDVSGGTGQGHKPASARRLWRSRRQVESSSRLRPSTNSFRSPLIPSTAPAATQSLTNCFPSSTVGSRLRFSRKDRAATRP